MTDLVAHILLFGIIVVIFLVIPLTIGRFVRPKLPTPEKEAIYECGEPTIGSSFIQFDMRFYVVALLFIIFDVEVAFFFPWATVFGGAIQLADTQLSDPARQEISNKLLNVPASETGNQIIEPDAALTLSYMGLFDILVFFGVLLVGFAYIWKRGDLDWVRAMTQQIKQAQAHPAVTSPKDAEASKEPESIGT